MLDDRGEHLARPAARQRALLDDHDPVRLPDRGEDGVEVERPERPEVDHLDRDAVRLELVRRLEAVVDALHRGDERDVATFAHDGRLAEPAGRAVHLALERVQALVLEEEHRVVVADRGLQQRLRVRRVRRAHDLEARYAHEPRRGHLRVDRAELAAGADDGADHERDADLLLRQEPVLRRLVDEAVHRERQEVAEHDLDDRPEAVHRRAERRARERQLGDRRVEDALRAVLVVEARRRREDAAGDGDVLAEEDHALVGGELLVERVADRGAKGDSRHVSVSVSSRSQRERERSLEQLA